MALEKIDKGSHVSVRLADGSIAAGTVTEIGGRLLKGDSVEPGWVRVKLEDGRQFPISEANLDWIINP